MSFYTTLIGRQTMWTHLPGRNGVVSVKTLGAVGVGALVIAIIAVTLLMTRSMHKAEVAAAGALFSDTTSALLGYDPLDTPQHSPRTSMGIVTARIYNVDPSLRDEALWWEFRRYVDGDEEAELSTEAQALLEALRLELDDLTESVAAGAWSGVTPMNLNTFPSTQARSAAEGQFARAFDLMLYLRAGITHALRQGGWDEAREFMLASVEVNGTFLWGPSHTQCLIALFFERELLELILSSPEVFAENAAILSAMLEQRSYYDNLRCVVAFDGLVLHRWLEQDQLELEFAGQSEDWGRARRRIPAVLFVYEGLLEQMDQRVAWRDLDSWLRDQAISDEDNAYARKACVAVLSVMHLAEAREVARHEALAALQAEE